MRRAHPSIPVVAILSCLVAPLAASGQETGVPPGPEAIGSRDRGTIYRLDPATERLQPVTSAELRPDHVYLRFDPALGGWAWGKASAGGGFRFAMGPGSVQPARMFDLPGTDADRQRILERKAPQLARLFNIQGARPMLRLDDTGVWRLGPTPSVSSVFDQATGERWEWHGDKPSRVVHAGGGRWRVQDGGYVPAW